MKYLILLLISLNAMAGLPPTTSKVSGDASDITTFKYQFPNFTGTHAGTTISLGVNSIAGGGTGATTKAAAFDALQPMTTGGDLIYGGASGTGTRLANGIAGQFLMSNGTTLAPSWTNGVHSAPTIQVFTTGSGTYTRPANVVYIKVRMVGGGGGGAGSGTAASGGTGGTGGATTFGTSLLTANGGVGGTSGSVGGLGGTVTVSAPAIQVIAMNGSAGGSQSYNSNSLTNMAGGNGAASVFGGAASGGVATTGNGAIANSGSGGGGAGISTTGAVVGGGGGAGGWIEAVITSPSATYSYAIGAAGSAGAAGTSGFGGGAGGAGYLVVEEYY